MQKHFHAADVSGYRKLAQQWMTSVPPSVDALKKAGIQTRKQGQGTEVYVRNQWMSIGAATRAGIL